MEDTGMYNEDIETGISHNYLEDVKIKNIKTSFKSLLLIVVIYVLSLVVLYLSFSYIQHVEVIIIIVLIILMPLYILFIYHLLIFLSCVINYFIDEIKLKLS